MTTSEREPLLTRSLVTQFAGLPSQVLVALIWVTWRLLRRLPRADLEGLDLRPDAKTLTLPEVPLDPAVAAQAWELLGQTGDANDPGHWAAIRKAAAEVLYVRLEVWWRERENPEVTDGPEAGSKLQDVFLRILMGRLGNYNCSNPLEAFLFPVVVHDYGLLPGPHPAPVDGAALPGRDRTPDDQAEQREQERLRDESSRRAARHLRNVQQRTIVFLRLRGLSNDFIIKLLDLPPGTVGTQVKRGLERLRAYHTAGGSVLRGRVRLGGRPLSGGTVTLTPRQGRPVAAAIDARGRFRLAKVPTGYATLCVRADPDHLPRPRRGAPRAPQPRESREWNGMTYRVWTGPQALTLDLP